MKGLLQSNRFKKNLRKWVFTYVVFMGLFTTVITYSKYISKMIDSSDGARVSKFDVALRYCADKTCDSETPVTGPFQYRPSNKMEYYFAVDKSKLEVNVDLILTISVDEHFKIEEIENITEGSEGNRISKNENDGKTVSITEHVAANDQTDSKYKVTLVYDESVIDYTSEECTEVSDTCKIINGVVRSDSELPHYIFDETQDFNALTVGYSATQTK